MQRTGLDEADFPPERVKALHLSKTDYYVKRVNDRQIELRPGIEPLLKEAMAAGLRLAITTTTSRVNVDRLLKATVGPEALDWFEVFVTGDRVDNKKPDPRYTNLGSVDLGLPAEACIAVEDAPQGLKSAMGAGVPTLITESSYSAGKDFTGAIKVIGVDGPPPTLDDIIAWHRLGFTLFR